MFYQYLKDELTGENDQKQVVQRLRNHVEPFKGALTKDIVSDAELLGLVNNNHITNNNDPRRRLSADADRVNGHAPRRRTSPKSDYEDAVRTSPVSQNHSAKNNRGTSSPEPNSGDDEIQELTAAPFSPVPEEDPNKAVERDQTSFLGRLNLITNDQLAELQKKRSERKRRSTASSHFVYTNWEQPQKRKKHAYLQSLGSAPQTRQTTAKLNGPSPPPEKSNASSRSTSSLSSSSKSAACARPNASGTTSASTSSTKPGPLRNGEISVRQQHKDFLKLMKKLEGGDKPESTQSSKSLLKQQKPEKELHIPGLPTGLTIERIQKDFALCVVCRNPGSFSMCEYCSSKFHISCHTVSPASPYFCPYCVAFFRSQGIYSTDWENLRLELKNVKPEVDTAKSAKLAARAGKRDVTGVAHGRIRDQERSILGPSKARKIASASSSKKLAAAATAAGIKKLPRSTTVIPIAGAAPVVLSGRPKKSTNARKSVGAPRTHFGYQFSDTQQQPQMQQQPSQRQTSILLNQLSKPSLDAALNREREIFINEMGREALRRRRMAETKKSTTKHTVSLLNPELLQRNAAKKLKDPKLTVQNADNSDYVTVEVVSNEENSSKGVKLSKESSPDCVYIPESPPRIPDLIDLESPEKEEEEEIENQVECQNNGGKQKQRQQEPEVLNVSSGSSTGPPTNSPQRVSASDVEPSSNSNSKDKDETEIDGAANIDDDSVTDIEYLSSIFPGKYGYKINIVMVDSSSSRSSSPLMNWSAPNSEDDVVLEENPSASSQVDSATETMSIAVPGGKSNETL
ncbi:hypothetical protein QAD02_015097 [Eretmocerus hayati]|uniref:Uncharacterized protein n=1 Tax=Eretmocerus hayati TaxID=131215 RepID=A0ACC2P7C0_9HYME|nr:hypothetical protein QAD02_015097 [Eretmocerus hayati]